MRDDVTAGRAAAVVSQGAEDDGGVGGEVERKIVRLRTLEIAGRAFADVEAAVDEAENAGALNIGVRVLRKFRITTDFEARTIWLDPR